MAINTYVELDKKTAASPVSSVEFTSIPSTYTDLILVVQAKGSSTQINLQFNGDTTDKYSSIIMYGDGSSAGKVTVNNQTKANIAGIADVFGTTTIHLNSYSNTTTYKTALSHYGFNGSYAETGSKVCMWRSTSAISSMLVFPTAGNWDSGSTFSLYGIKAWANTEASPKATGGWVSSDSSYWYHTFPFSSTFTVSQALTADILTVGGGSSGIYGNYAGPGGGGGETKVSTSQSLSVTSYAVTVGAGGAATTSGASWTAGATTSFGSITALGAGQSPYTTAGQSGTGFTANGGVGGSTASEYSGGGGGSTANGTAAAGGAGLTTSISGVSTSYGGGGGGGLGTNYTIGVSYGSGTDGGGNGASSAGPGTRGAPTRGGGGGGGTQFRGATSGAAGNGGSGLVIVRYAK